MPYFAKQLQSLVLTDGQAAAIQDFCTRWRIKELAVFGSVLREDFSPDSDIDVLITWDEDAQWSLFDWVDMKDELQTIFGREVDAVLKSGLRNPFRRREILATCEVIYAG
jgi:hypothetical protein